MARCSGSLGSVRSTCGVPEAGPRSHVPVPRRDRTRHRAARNPGRSDVSRTSPDGEGGRERPRTRRDLRPARSLPSRFGDTLAHSLSVSSPAPPRSCSPVSPVASATRVSHHLICVSWVGREMSLEERTAIGRNPAGRRGSPGGARWPRRRSGRLPAPFGTCPGTRRPLAHR